MTLNELDAILNSWYDILYRLYWACDGHTSWAGADLGWACVLEAPYLHDFCTQYQHIYEAASPYMVSHCKFFLIVNGLWSKYNAVWQEFVALRQGWKIKEKHKFPDYCFFKYLEANLMLILLPSLVLESSSWCIQATCSPISNWRCSCDWCKFYSLS